ncbi:FAD-dependent oxidoreductase, partial [Rhizobium sp.]|uniref:FAD-dependent oxidoreductase n=1 Tax=Rhizobium sp. TaxID=391 RepID=UPI002EF7BB53
INGTTGYEEAGAQGLLAGINAALKAGQDSYTTDSRETIFQETDSRETFVVSRTSAYLGVMVDDLVTRGISEPYRMFTSRAEYRLSLRADNADVRLTPLGLTIGCVGNARAARFGDYMEKLEWARAQLNTLSVTPSEAEKAGLHINKDGQRRTAYDLLSYPEHSIDSLSGLWPELRSIDRRVVEAVEIEAAYAVYMDRQTSDIVQARREEERLIPQDFDFSILSGLSNELKQKLAMAQPKNIAQASRIDGMTPAAISLLLAHLRKLTVVEERKLVS